jgi:putative ABC transport system substrate-binding protein
VRRREFITLFGAAVVWPLAVHAQQGERTRRIAALIPFPESDTEAQSELAAFRKEFQRLGWTEGHNARIEVRWAGGDVVQIRDYAKELVALQPDVIVARTTPVTAALLEETRTIPIVFIGPSDPVGAGFVASMARPGANATGFTNVEASLGGKWVELLREINPRIDRIAVMFDPKTSPGGGMFYLRQVQDAARSITVETIALPVQNADEIERAIEVFARGRNRGLLVQPDITSHNNRTLIISLSARHHLPSIYGYPYYVVEGGLAAYGVDIVDLYRRAAAYVDRILRGERPDQLAVQAPVKFNLAINLKTANAMGLDVPPMVLARADEVIE